MIYKRFIFILLKVRELLADRWIQLVHIFFNASPPDK
jgi:hypothetical protein